MPFGIVSRLAYSVAILLYFIFGSDYGVGYAWSWPEAIQIKGSACHSNGVGLVLVV